MLLTQKLAPIVHRSNVFTKYVQPVMPNHYDNGLPSWFEFDRETLFDIETGALSNYKRKRRLMQLTETTFGEGRGPGNATTIAFPTVEYLLENGSIFVDGTTVRVEDWEKTLKAHKYVQAHYGDGVDEDGVPTGDWFTDKGIKGYNAAKKRLTEILTNHFDLDNPKVRLKVSFSTKYDDFETRTRRDAKADGVIVYTLSVDNSPLPKPTSQPVTNMAADNATDTVADDADASDTDSVPTD